MYSFVGYLSIVIPKERFVVLDLLRGFFVASLVVIHLRLWPNLLMAISGGSKLWVSVGIGFFCISGFLFGYINRVNWKLSKESVLQRVLKRARVLYTWSILTTVIFTLWGNLLPPEFRKSGMWELNGNNTMDMLLKTLTFQYVYGWADYLNYYVVYILLSPIFFFLIEKYSWRLVVLISGLFYSFHGASVYFGMQFVFFVSLAAGFCFDDLRDFWQSLGEKLRGKIDVFMMRAFFITILVSIFSVHYFERFVNLFIGSEELVGYLVHKNRVLNLYFDKQSVAVGRIVLWPFWLYGFVAIFSKYKDFLVKFLGGFLVYIGQNPLKVYLIHSFVVFPTPYFVSLLSVDNYLERTLFSGFVLWLTYFISKRLIINI